MGILTHTYPDGSVVKANKCLRNMKCAVYDLEFMGLNPGHVELGVRSACVSGT